MGCCCESSIEVKEGKIKIKKKEDKVEPNKENKNEIKKEDSGQNKEKENINANNDNNNSNENMNNKINKISEMEESNKNIKKNTNDKNQTEKNKNENEKKENQNIIKDEVNRNKNENKINKDDENQNLKENNINKNEDMQIKIFKEKKDEMNYSNKNNSINNENEEPIKLNQNENEKNILNNQENVSQNNKNEDENENKNNNQNEFIKININTYYKGNDENQNIINNIDLHKNIDKETLDAEKNEEKKLRLNNIKTKIQNNEEKIEEENNENKNKQQIIDNKIDIIPNINSNEKKILNINNKDNKEKQNVDIKKDENENNQNQKSISNSNEKENDKNKENENQNQNNIVDNKGVINNNNKQNEIINKNEIHQNKDSEKTKKEEKGDKQNINSIKKEEKDKEIKNQENKNANETKQNIIKNNEVQDKKNNKDNIQNEDKKEKNLNNKQNDIIKQENNSKQKDKENLQNQNKLNDEIKIGEKQIIKNKITEKQENINKQKEQNINNDSTISKILNDMTIKDKVNEITNKNDEGKGAIINMKQNQINQKLLQKEIPENKENITHNKILKTEKTELPLQILNKEEKEEKKELKGKQKDNQKELSFNKDSCKKIASSLPTRKQVNYSTLKTKMKEKTENLNDKEKSYVLFLWICDNISYDVDSYFAGRSVDCTPEGVYKNGQSVCSGYSRLFKNIADFLNLEVQCVSCYAKGVSYQVGQKMTETNHEYNVIKLNDKWYPIDSTWGAGSAHGKKYVKSLNEFYFLADPELLIKTHFPQDDKWQLTKKKYTLDEFLKWPRIKSTFYAYGFKKCLPNEGLIELKDANTKKFIIYGDDMNTKGGSCNLYLLEGNTYIQQLNATIINFYDDRLEVDTIYNKKGKYLVRIYGNKDRGKNFIDMLEYTVQVENDSKQKLFFPTFYLGHEDINVIEPLYNNLKSGQKVKFKVKSKYENLVVIDDKWNKMIRKENGFHEIEIKIKTQKNSTIGIARLTGATSCSYLAKYNIV